MPKVRLALNSRPGAPRLAARRLPISQRLIWLGPLFILVQWGESARLVRAAEKAA